MTIAAARRRSSMSMALFLLATALPCSTVQAQTAEQLFRGVLDAAKQARREQPATPIQGVVTAVDLRGAPQPSAAGSQPVPWPSKDALLAAARAGDFVQLNRASEADRYKVVDSVQRILTVEYGVPSISRDCYQIGGFTSDVTALFGDIGEAYVITLSDQPPTFTNANVNRSYYVESIRSRLAQMQNPRDPTHCDSRSAGRVVPHPYKAALISLVGDYTRATQAYIEAERSRRQAEYREAASRQLQEQQLRQAASRAAEQQRIDSEAARIRAEEQRRAQKEKARVGG